MRIGYACLSVLVHNCSTAKTITATRLETIPDPEGRLYTLRQIARANLQNTRRLIFHNAAHGLHLYRITPQLVPLATHPITADWDWQGELAAEFAEVGQVMRDHQMRISSHPGQYVVLSSARAQVVDASIADLSYHARLHELLDHGSDGRLVLHVGGAQGGKDKAMGRFVENFQRLSPAVKSRLVLENDDTTYGTGEVLPLCQLLSIPMVLDLHHHALNPAGADLREVLPAIFATWPPGTPPKIHVSSPASEKDPRAHADYVNPADVRAFIELAAAAGVGDFDIMVEAKKKDEAALKLAADLGLHLDTTYPGRTARSALSE